MLKSRFAHLLSELLKAIAIPLLSHSPYPFPLALRPSRSLVFI